MGSAIDLLSTPFNLGSGSTVTAQAPWDGTMQWYERYGIANAADGTEGRLVSMHTFAESWDSWEMHPVGHEMVICTAGEIMLVQELDGNHEVTTLTAGQAAVNEPGVWHTADVTAEATVLFITAGAGTEHRAR